MVLLFTCRLTFNKSYEKGHVMSVVKKGLMTGEEIAKEYSSNYANTKVFFVLDSKQGTAGSYKKLCCRLLWIVIKIYLLHVYLLYSINTCITLSALGKQFLDRQYQMHPHPSYLLGHLFNQSDWMKNCMVQEKKLPKECHIWKFQEGEGLVKESIT